MKKKYSRIVQGTEVDAHLMNVWNDILDDAGAKERELGQDRPSTAEQPDYARAASLEALHARMDSRRFAGIFVRPWVVAAVVALLIALPASVAFLMSGNVPPQKIVLASADDSRSDYLLPDGTKVVLNSRSRLEYCGMLEKGARRIRLSGEAFFDVAKTGQEFIVEMGDVDVKVLGTRFNARSSDVYGESSVTLEQGSVLVCGGSIPDVRLVPGQQFACGRGSSSWTVDNVDTEIATCWTGDRLVFSNKSLDYILHALEHWYNCDIDIAETVNISPRLSFTLFREDLTEALAIIDRLSGTHHTVSVKSKTNNLIN